jgi:hypothetical protein
MDIVSGLVEMKMVSIVFFCLSRKIYNGGGGDSNSVRIKGQFTVTAKNKNRCILNNETLIFRTTNNNSSE